MGTNLGQLTFRVRNWNPNLDKTGAPNGTISVTGDFLTESGKVFGRGEFLAIPGSSFADLASHIGNTFGITIGG